MGYLEFLHGFAVHFGADDDGLRVVALTGYDFARSAGEDEQQACL